MATPGPAASAAHRPAAGKARASVREQRQQALAEVRRSSVLDAARSAFFELGMERASMREIAQRAGYTVGALYSYFASKEEVYGALLAESLERLNARVQSALDVSGGNDADDATRRVQRSARAFFDFYRANPRDLDLGFYLFQGMKPRGLTPELNDALNARLLQALQPCRDELRRLGMPAAAALQEVTALFAHAVGLLVLSHTGRIRMFRQDSAGLFRRYLDRLVERAGAHEGS